MNNLKGTPQTLDQAIEDALCIGPLNDVQNRTYLIIKDYLAQKFGTAMLQAKDSEADRLQQLYQLIIRRN